MKRQPTIEWQVCGVCNYDCSYCIQSKKSRVGHPTPTQIDQFLDFFANLPKIFPSERLSSTAGEPSFQPPPPAEPVALDPRPIASPWEVKMSGGEPFAFRGFMERIIPGLLERTTHRLSVLTNLSAPTSILERFAKSVGPRLGIISASFHQEFVDIDEFVAKATALRDWIHPSASLVINSVMVPESLHRLPQVGSKLADHQLRLFPQWLKTKHGRHSYSPAELEIVEQLCGPAPNSRQANFSPSYRGHRCWTGVEYFALTQTGDAWSCRTARRHKEGYLGNVFSGGVQLWSEPRTCPYDICPCTVPANRGMIEGI